MGFIKDANQSGKVIIIAGVVYNQVRQEFIFNNRSYSLDPKTNSLFEFLLDAPGNVFSVTDILLGVWGSEFISRNVITNRIGMIRSFFIENFSVFTDVIITYPRKGYGIKAGIISLVELDDADKTNAQNNADSHESTASFNHASIINNGSNDVEMYWPPQSRLSRLILTGRKFFLFENPARKFVVSISCVLLVLLVLILGFALGKGLHLGSGMVFSSSFSGTNIKSVRFSKVIVSENNVATNDMDVCYKVIDRASRLALFSVVNLNSPNFFYGVRKKSFCPGGSLDSFNGNVHFEVEMMVGAEGMQVIIHDRDKNIEYYRNTIIELQSIDLMVADAIHYINTVLYGSDLESIYSASFKYSHKDDDNGFSTESRGVVNGGDEAMLDDLVHRMVEYDKHIGLSLENKVWLLLLHSYRGGVRDALDIYNHSRDVQGLQNPLVYIVAAYLLYEAKDYHLAANYYFNAMALITKHQPQFATECFDNGCRQSCQSLNGGKEQGVFWSVLFNKYCKVAEEIK